MYADYRGNADASIPDEKEDGEGAIWDRYSGDLNI